MFYYVFGECLCLLWVEFVGGLVGGGDGVFDFVGIEGDFMFVVFE